MTFTKNLSRFTIPANPPSNAAPERLLDQLPPAIFPAIAPRNPVDKPRVEALIHDKHRYDHTPITPLSDAIEALYSAYPNHRPLASWLTYVRTKVVNWSARWGGINNWEDALEILFERACTEGEVAARAFVKRALERKRKGYILRSELALCALREFHLLRYSPQGDPLSGDSEDRVNDDIMRTLWEGHNEQVMVLDWGIKIVETKVPLDHDGRSADSLGRGKVFEFLDKEDLVSSGVAVEHSLRFREAGI